jgi:hypothetical protein
MKSSDYTIENSTEEANSAYKTHSVIEGLGDNEARFENEENLREKVSNFYNSFSEYADPAETSSELLEENFQVYLEQGETGYKQRLEAHGRLTTGSRLVGDLSLEDWNQNQPLWMALQEKHGEAFYHFAGDLAEEYFEFDVTDDRAMDLGEQFNRTETLKERERDRRTTTGFVDHYGDPDRGPAEKLVEEVIFEQILDDALNGDFEDRIGGRTLENEKEEFSDFFYRINKGENSRIREEVLTQGERELIGL